MLRKSTWRPAAGMVLATVFCVPAFAQSQYDPYQSQYSPYQQQQYNQYQYQQPYQQQQYNQYQQQYAPSQSQYGYQYQQQQQYAPGATAYQAMPDYCRQNNAATGAVVGGLIGGVIGGALGGGRGAAIGAGSGMLFGGLTGAQADAQCRQIALQRAYAAAAAQQAAIQRQVAAEAARHRGELRLPRSAYVPVTEEYRTPSNGHRHRITVKRLNSFSDPAHRRICDTFTKIDTDLDGDTQTQGTSRRCKGPDGKWHDS